MATERVLIFGSREYPDLQQVRDYVATLPRSAIVISGGARGVDAVAVEAARARGLRTEVFKPDYAQYGKGATFKRNIIMAQVCTRAAGFWDGRSRGTMHTIGCVEQEGKPLTLTTPGGIGIEQVRSYEEDRAVSKDMNLVIFSGRLGKDPEVKYTPGGKAVSTFTVASNRYAGTNDDGSRKEHTEWQDIVAWEQLAEQCAQSLHKGSRVQVMGRLQTRSWEDQQTGQKRYRTEIVANEVMFLDPPPARAAADAAVTAADAADDDAGLFEEEAAPPPPAPAPAVRRPVTPASHAIPATGGRRPAPAPARAATPTRRPVSANRTPVTKEEVGF